MFRTPAASVRALAGMSFAQAPSPMTMKRINREIHDLKKEDMGDIRLNPSETSLLEWTGAIPGPTGSVYEGGVFEFNLTLPHDYPFSAPKIMFKTRIYHMNIAESGHICLDILKNAWSPALSIFKVILSLSSLFTDPNPNDPLVPSIAIEYTRKRQQHDKTARTWTQLYATPRPNPSSILPTVRTRQSNPSFSAIVAPRPGPSSARPAISRSAPAELIEISDDDDDEREDIRSAAAQSGTKRKRGPREAGERDVAASKKAKADVAEGSSAGRGRTTANVSRSRTVPQEIIVIDD